MDALEQLERELLPHLDGCATGSAPDANDWLITCAGQAKVYPQLMKLIAALEAE